jgi:hypothetical protein
VVTPLGLVGIFKNEAPYLDEWLRYYVAQGVTDVRLYDNGSTDGWRPSSLGVRFEIVSFPGVARQLPAYHDAIGTMRTRVEWLIFADVDEFFYDTSGARLADVVAPCTDDEILWAPWRMFGWGPHETKPEGGVVENYLWRAPDDDPDHCYAQGKEIVRPKAVLSLFNPHHFIPRSGKTRVLPTLRVNHYYTRSREEARAKCAKGRVDTGGFRDWQIEFERKAARYSTVYDPRLAEIVGKAPHRSAPDARES